MVSAGHALASRSHCANAPTTQPIVDRRRLFRQSAGETVSADSMTSIQSGRIAGEMETAIGLGKEESPARVRTLFLRLIGMNVSIPCHEGPPQTGPIPE